MPLLISFSPILLFISLYVGCGVYFALLGIENAFYQLSPVVAIIPAIALGWLLYRGTTAERMDSFLDGVRHRDIITMCIIFLLAGAFSTVTKAIGSVDATVHFALSTIPPQFLLIGLFLTAAFIATAIGTSMATIATVAPIAAALAEQGAFPVPLGMATVIGGAMFGDNLSVVSDTTIAAVMSQKANLRKKLKLNAIIAAIASAITLLILVFSHTMTMPLTHHHDYSLILISPYILLLLLAILGVNVFVLLSVTLAFTGILGFVSHGYSLLNFGQDIAKGFASMQEIMVLSLLIGGLSGLSGKSALALTEQLSHWISKNGGKRMAQLVIAKLASIFDILLANNTIAIIFSGEMARNIAKRYHIPAHYSATWLHIFSCVFQGILPYGAQMLLAASIAGVSPLSIMPYVYYCYVLGIITLLFILFNRKLVD